MLVGSPKMLTFCQHLKGRKCQHMRIGGQKKPISCQRTL